MNPYETHQVTNQAPPLVDINCFGMDPVLQEGVVREGAPWAKQDLLEFGALVGSAQVQEWGELANQNPPELHTHDRYGHRIDEVRFHPAYHHLMKLGMKHGVHSAAWTETREGAHVARIARHFLLNHAEASVCCPLTMTFAVYPALNVQPDVAEVWAPRVTSTVYDARFIPAHEKQGCTMGMAMTEKQGGSDVRTNTTQARPANGAGPGNAYYLTGHKWFCSAPMSDAFLALAQTEVGLTCFLVPRFTPDGEKNRIYIQRLKDKLGNHANASSEIEYRDTWAVMVGEEGRGVPTIIEMVNHTRLDCISGTAGMMRAALVQAMHHAKHRKAFGQLLWQQPLMRNVLADLALESEAATVLLLRLARAYDQSDNPQSRLFARLATAVGKYWVCKRGPGLAFEAMECHGGAGYVEETMMPRIYREMPITSIWEGSGNVMCLDVLRAMGREPDCVAAFAAELAQAKGGNPLLDQAMADLRNELQDTEDMPFRARHLVERMALTLQASLLVRHAPNPVADAFCASRLGKHGHQYGTLPKGTAVDAILERVLV